MSKWVETTLGESCEIYQPKTISAADLVEDGAYPVYGANGVIGRYDKFNHAEPQLLITCRGATCGTVNVSVKNSWINGNAMVVRPRSNSIDLKYLEYLFRGGLDLSTVITGAAQPQITRQSLAPLKVQFPPLPKQRRIAAILDLANALRAKRREALAHLNRLAQAIFIEMFGDPLTNSKKWPDSMVLGEVADIVSGVTKGRNLSGKQTRLIPYLAVANVQDKALSLGAIKSIEATEEEIQRYRLKKNDLLLTEGGDPDKLGRGTLWNDELPECIHQNHIFRVRLSTERITPIFLNWLVGSQRGKKYFLRSAKQTTGIASINMTQLRSFPLLMPPLELQEKFSNCLSCIHSQQRLLAQLLAETDALFAALQHRAFRGEL